MMSWDRGTLRGLTRRFDQYAGPWELLWRWHFMRMFGYDLRRRVEEDLHGLYHFWQYGRSKTVAREMLHSVYGEGAPHSGPYAPRVFD